MKNLKFKLLNFVYLAVAYFVLASLVVQPSVNLFIGTTVAAFVVGTVVSLANPLSGALRSIQVEIWQNHIEEEIFKSNTFLRLSHSADDYVLNSKVVHIPQSGGSGNVVKNRSTVPATVRKRTDTDIVYALDEYTTDPVLIPHADTKELSYDKRDSVLREDMDKINQVIAENTLFNWVESPAVGAYAASALPAGKKIDTTGADVAATAPSATGTRKAATRNDLQTMQRVFMEENRWFEGKMNALIPPAMLVQMFPANDVVTATYMNNVTEEERRKGILFKAHGWNIYSRSSVLIVKADESIGAPGEAAAATDDQAALFWYQDAVEFAFGGVEAFEKMGDPQFYGDVYSFLARTGSRARRAGYEGVAVLKEGETA
jgi:hypothetical protein